MQSTICKFRLMYIVASLSTHSLSLFQIAAKTGMTKAKVYRLLKKAQQAGIFVTSTEKYRYNYDSYLLADDRTVERLTPYAYLKITKDRLSIFDKMIIPNCESNGSDFTESLTKWIKSMVYMHFAYWLNSYAIISHTLPFLCWKRAKEFT